MGFFPPASATPAGAWEKIGIQTLTSAAAIITFSGINSKYKMFRVHSFIVNDGSAMNVPLRLNNDSGANYEWQRLNAGTGFVAQRQTAQTSVVLFNFAIQTNAVGVSEALIAKPLAGNHAMVLCKDSALSSIGADQTDRVGHTWKNTSDLINRIDVIASTGNMDPGSTVMIEGNFTT